MTNALATRPIKGYRASQNADGTWDIFDVPIYAANVRSFGLMPVLDKKTGDVVPQEMIVNHDAAWLEGTIATAQLDYAEREYRAPLHIHHHNRGEKVEEAGEIMPRYVKKIMYEGSPLDTLFADLHNVPDAVYQQIAAKRLRYRSAECPMSMDERPEIKSLALLPHQPPHFKLPPLVTDGTPMTANAQALVGCYSSKTGIQMLSLFDAQEDTDQAGGRIIDDQKDVKDPARDASKGDVRAQDENQDTNKKGGFMEKLLLLMTAIAAKMGIGVSDANAMPKGPAEQPKGDETKDPMALALAQAKVAPTSALPVASFDPSEWAAMKAKMAVYDARFAAVDADGKAKTDVEKALADLKGFNVTDTMRSEMLEAAKLGDKPLAMYVSTIKTYGIKDPPKDPLTTGLAGMSRDPYPAEVLAYQAQGEAVLAKAVENWQSYKSLGNRVSHVKLADWLKVNVAAGAGENFFGN